MVQSLRGTPEHPFFTPGGMAAMGDLKPEMTVISRRGPPLVVKCVTREYYPAGIAVYNFEVEDDHAYFVGTAQGGAWVHNIGDCDPLRPNVATKLPNRVTKELPEGEMRTAEEKSQARNFFERNKDEARGWWENRTGQEWPANSTHHEHPRALKDGGDPLYVEPGFDGPAQPHMGPGDFRQWGALGGRPRKL